VIDRLKLRLRKVVPYFAGALSRRPVSAAPAPWKWGMTLGGEQFGGPFLLPPGSPIS